MDPITLLAIVAAAGFVFSQLSSQSKANKRNIEQELTYSRDTVAAAKRNERSDFDLSTIEVLQEYKLAKQLVQHDFPLIFVTGGAGTGKSTFVKWFTNEFNGRVLLAAPTGLAAVNIGLPPLLRTLPIRVQFCGQYPGEIADGKGWNHCFRW